MNDEQQKLGERALDALKKQSSKVTGIIDRTVAKQREEKRSA
jgi:hypothetical protein